VEGRGHRIDNDETEQSVAPQATLVRSLGASPHQCDGADESRDAGNKHAREEEDEVGGKPLLKGAGPCEIEEGDEARSDREHDAKKARASRYSDEFHDAFQIASDFGTLTLSLAKVKWKLQRKEELGE